MANIKQKFLKKFDEFKSRIKRGIRRTLLACMLMASVAVGAVAYTGYLVMPHVPNIISVAKLIDGEARGESRQGQKAVFGTILAPQEARGAHSYCTHAACVRQSGYFGTLKRIGQIGNHVFYGDCNEEPETVTVENTAAPVTAIRPVRRPENLTMVSISPYAPITAVRPVSRPGREQSVALAEQNDQQTEIDLLIASVVDRSK